MSRPAPGRPSRRPGCCERSASTCQHGPCCAMERRRALTPPKRPAHRPVRGGSVAPAPLSLFSDLDPASRALLLSRGGMAPAAP